MVGDGVQIIGMPVVTTGFLALGFMSPASRGIDAADRDDFTVSFPGYCGGLCCSTFAESHRRSSRRKKGSHSSTGAIPISLCFVLLVLHFSATNSLGRIQRDNSIPSENKPDTLGRRTFLV
ncbi:hypothetical protein POTOM_050426 [Populus tomentosa]|uniref:Uncharacterized protein n=1 Tax=Populus tomentosa TaxID=118781 RepID=A0A8X7Y7L1_POPTO|nr:hypothetical protein POTOM_050426 [Populus tomentosa]